MIELSLHEIAEATGGRVAAADVALSVQSVVTDSRDAGPGALFVALRGEHADGHDFLDDAFERRATAALTEREHGHAGVVVVDDTWKALGHVGRLVRDRVDPLVVAITGSIGKTTTKDLTSAALGAGLLTEAAQGSFNNELGVPLTLLRLSGDTQALVVEIGARGLGDIATLTPLVQPDVAVVTAVVGAHLEQFHDLETVAQAKGELVDALSARGTAILNADDPRVAGMASRTDARVLGYGYVGDSDLAAEVTAHDVTLDRLARASFRVASPWGSTEVHLPLAGVHHVGNALAALAAAGALGVDLEAAAAALAGARVSRWRSQVSEVDGVVVINDAYNASPTSLEAGLRTLVAIEHTGATWAVLGYMAELGATEDEAHRRMGRRVAELGVDRLIVVGGARPLYEGAAAAGLVADHRWHVDDVQAALRVLRPRLEAGDVVLVKASRVAGLEQVADGLGASGEATT
ncbi:MAG TPA: UDP-N-acetylmuramoyl-tripeptide--D-alanyl-D-alanine ligase [Nitriliruptorales bacterium]